MVLSKQMLTFVHKKFFNFSTIYLIFLLIFSIFQLLVANTKVYDVYYKLNDHFHPLKYDIKLSLDSHSNEITGQVVIDILCQKTSTYLELHSDSNFILFKHVTIHENNKNKSIVLDDPVFNYNTQTVILKYPKSNKYRKNKLYKLTIWYRTKYSEHLRGFMKIEDNVNGNWVNSLLEMTYARQVFPSFDEPRWKSVFRLQLWLSGEFAKASYIALSNTEGSPFMFSNNLTIWTFKSTPPIPTYLFTVSIGKFDNYCCENKIQKEKDICIWKFNRSKDPNWHDVAEDVCYEIKKYKNLIDKYLNIDTKAKEHFLIVPCQLNGMENFGLLQVSERLWPKKNNTRSMVTFTKTLTHEMAHQFFGNLVTIKWWNDIWIAESLTSFISMKRPYEFRVEIDNSEEPLIDKKWAEKIPHHVYVKGPAVLMMLEDVIGPHLMKKLLRKFIKKYALTSVDSQDFFNILKHVTHMHMPMALPFFKSWLYQGSYPLVFIDFDEENKLFTLSQTPKYGNPKNRWLIPIWVDCAVGTVPEKLFWITKNSNLVLHINDLTKTNKSAAVAFNRNRSVYYSVIYNYFTM
ncbi:Peptidase M1, membrane alanine aminopeptidase,N-terminal domain-containing protein [Strongyloides ratti]|uniref:Peptidase M1, membrane alanine aminopeptidase,N-terminal domain-containing protein n=1 Tax=Strongyloides ratti TaxID=34506 RepID=A0A090MPS8_STRRB|nr:Peptidase M1, membrane alanine aminopeptidase,N-terminal domain-containing protein [Strongyloides ratti]CEF60137.1 Peptidase M1, membrane alanine aminopeptidase,N-terminal domain-containing protein [Strongyloides ratti]